jgi:hypothetical protein
MQQLPKAALGYPSMGDVEKAIASNHFRAAVANASVASFSKHDTVSRSRDVYAADYSRKLYRPCVQSVLVATQSMGSWTDS